MKYRITMWNPDCEQESKVVIEKEASNTNNLITSRDFIHAVWAYVTRQPFITVANAWVAKETMYDERGVHLPIKLGEVGNKVEFHPNNDDYTYYVFERIE